MKIIILIIPILILSVCLALAEKEWVMVSPSFGEYDDNMGIYCYDSLNCVAFIDIYYKKKLIQKSYNGGRAWEVFQEFDYSDVTSDSVDRPYRTFIFDSLQYYTLYYDGLVLDKSTDGGETFKRTEFSEDILDLSLRNLIMYSKNMGVTLRSSLIIYTQNNWNTFYKIKPPNAYYFEGPFYFLDSNNVIFSNLNFKCDTCEYITDFIKYNITKDEWSLYSNLEKKDIDKATPYVTNISRVNDSLIFACGSERTGVADLAYDLVWKSIDNGRTWENILRQSKDLGIGLSQISFRNEKHGIAVGNWGNIIETTDGGQSWFQYPRLSEMASIKSEITWAGETALYTAYATGIFRLETKSAVEELSSNERFKVYKSGHNLEIAINDETYSKYQFQLYNSSGQQLQSNKLNSNYGFVFETVPIKDLNNGVYFYTLSKNGSIHFNGKFVVVE